MVGLSIYGAGMFEGEEGQTTLVLVQFPKFRSKARPKIMYQLSYWEAATFFEQVDCFVIGSGIVGLNTALRLKEQAPRLRVAVLERGPLPIGASTRNAGFACFGSVSELLDDLESMEESSVWALVRMRWQGLQRLRRRLGDDTLEYRNWGGYELFRKRGAFESCAAHIPAFNRQLQAITGLAETYTIASEKAAPFGFRGVTGLIWNRAEGQLHTGRMMKGLAGLCRASGIPIYSGVGVTHLEDGGPGGVTLRTEQGWVLNASMAAVATNGFARRLLPELEVKPARNQVLITPPIPGLRLQGCFHYDRGYYYFRNIDGRLLLGGGRQLDEAGESTDQFGNNALIRRSLLDLMATLILPGQRVEVDRWWSGILGVGARKQPIIRQVSPNVVAAVRLGGMGIAIGSLVGEEAADLLLGKG